MPGPPTPVSGCPLKRLEIRDGVSTRSYASAPPTSVFTLTLEGERSIDSETGTLVLLIHHDQQRLISIRLTDVLRNSSGASGIVAIDKVHLQLCIRVPNQSNAVLAQFEENRDFNVAVCMLKKSNFVIHDSISSILSSPSPASQPSEPLTFDAASNFGPRLSSLTSFHPALTSHRSNSLGSPEPVNFTELLNSPIPNTHLMPMFVQPTPPAQPSSIQRMHSFPNSSNFGPSPLDSTSFGMQLNPYNMFLGRNDNFYRPRVSSPLKYSFHPGEPSRHPSNASVESNTSLSSMFLPVNAQNTYHSAAAPIPFGSVASSRPSSPLGDYQHTNVYEMAPPAASMVVSNPQSPPAGRTDQQTSVEKDFRDLMPQPRKLPFDSQPKRQSPAKAKSKEQSTLKTTPKKSSPVKGTPKKKNTSKKTHSNKIPDLPADSPRKGSPPQKLPQTKKQSNTKAITEKPSPVKVTPEKKSPARTTSKKQTPVKATPEKISKKVPDSVEESPGNPPPRTLPPRRAKTVWVKESPKKGTPPMKRTRIKIILKRPREETVPIEATHGTQRRQKRQKVSGENQPKRACNATIRAETPSPTCSPSPLSSPPAVSSPAELSYRPILFLDAHDTLKEVNQAADRLLEQYQADMTDSTDKAASARFYMDQIYAARRDSWYAKLVEMEQMRSPMVT